MFFPPADPHSVRLVLLCNWHMLTGLRGISLPDSSYFDRGRNVETLKKNSPLPRCSFRAVWFVLLYLSI